MAFADVEKSRAGAAPIELFTFVGNYNTYRLTSYNKDITNSAGTFTRSAVKRSSLEGGTQEDNNVALTIEIPFDHPMVVEYAYNESPPSLYMTMERAHPDDLNDTLLQWQGQVISWSVENGVAKLSVPSLFGYIFDGPLPPVKYQAPCNHILYGTFCAVDDTAYKQDVTVTAIDNNVVTLSANTFADGYCNGGDMIFASGGERRMIINNVGTVFTLATQFAGLAVDDTVTIRAGCNHQFSVCKSKFNNGINFGGCPLVPNRNPYRGRI